MRIDGVEFEAQPAWQLLLELRVDAGEKWLDDVEPGWYNRIKPEYLYMNQGSSCVCGQVFNRMWQVEQGICGEMDDVSGWEYFESRFQIDGEELGFESFHLCEEGHAGCDNDNCKEVTFIRQYSYLAEAWIRRVEKKLANQG